MLNNMCADEWLHAAVLNGLHVGSSPGLSLTVRLTNCPARGLVALLLAAFVFFQRPAAASRMQS